MKSHFCSRRSAQIKKLRKTNQVQNSISYRNVSVQVLILISHRALMYTDPVMENIATLIMLTSKRYSWMPSTRQKMESAAYWSPLGFFTSWRHLNLIVCQTGSSSHLNKHAKGEVEFVSPQLENVSLESLLVLSWESFLGLMGSGLTKLFQILSSPRAKRAGPAR